MTSIPNLNTLRKSRGGIRSITRRSNQLESSQQQPSTQNAIIQQTDNDASSSRLSAVELGYLVDNYARAFSTSNEPPVRRYPLINRGTYVRTVAIDRLVVQFLQDKSSTRKQIISLGAGSDTRFFRLGNITEALTYHELDFEVNIEAKKTAIQRSPLLSSRREELAVQGCSLHLHAVDLRDLSHATSTQLEGMLLDVPTIIISECCLCYLTLEEASHSVAYFLQQLQGSVGLVLYEPIRPHDAFGRTMTSNLASRRIHMPTLQQFTSLGSQRQRLKQLGFSDLQGARDVYEIWESNEWISEGERERIDKLEWLDEIEEWSLLASHYCIVWACKGEDIVQSWRSLQGDPTKQELKLDASYT